MQPIFFEKQKLVVSTKSNRNFARGKRKNGEIFSREKEKRSFCEESEKGKKNEISPDVVTSNTGGNFPVREFYRTALSQMSLWFPKHKKYAEIFRLHHVFPHICFHTSEENPG